MANIKLDPKNFPKDFIESYSKVQGAIEAILKMMPAKDDAGFGAVLHKLFLIKTRDVYKK